MKIQVTDGKVFYNNKIIGKILSVEETRISDRKINCIIYDNEIKRLIKIGNNDKSHPIIKYDLEKYKILKLKEECAGEIDYTYNGMALMNDKYKIDYITDTHCKFLLKENPLEIKWVKLDEIYYYEDNNKKVYICQKIN